MIILCNEISFVVEGPARDGKKDDFVVDYLS
jgi:hypothetical protein